MKNFSIVKNGRNYTLDWPAGCHATAPPPERHSWDERGDSTNFIAQKIETPCTLVQCTHEINYEALGREKEKKVATITLKWLRKRGLCATQWPFKWHRITIFREPLQRTHVYKLYVTLYCQFHSSENALFKFDTPAEIQQRRFRQANSSQIRRRSRSGDSMTDCQIDTIFEVSKVPTATSANQSDGDKLNLASDWAPALITYSVDKDNN